MSCENIMLNERRQTGNITHYMIPLVWDVQNGQIHRDRSVVGGQSVGGVRIPEAGRESGEENGWWLLNWYGVFYSRIK